MRDRLSWLPGGLILFAVLLIAGCSSTAKTSSDKGSPSSEADAPDLSSKSGSSSLTEEATARELTGPSSLEAAREGKTPSTPMESPLKEIYFDFDRSDLRPDAREILKINAGWLRANPSARVEIEGHCDERGTTEYNVALGAKRAQAAKDYLVTLGVAADRLSTISYGKELPVCKDHNEECWQKNRRDRFVLVGGRPAS
jgi:peptidoglycan-associated lipoprotein